MNDLVRVVAVVTAVACGLAAGAFMTFSTFVMPALDDLDDDGLAAMQSINRYAVHPPFMVALFLPALACLGLAVWAVTAWDTPGARWVLAGAVAYVVGAVVLTAVGNVPLNDAMAALPATAGSGRWHDLAASWLRWNHVRLLLTTVGAALLTVGAVLGS